MFMPALAIAGDTEPGAFALNDYFASITALAGLVVVVSQFVIKLFPEGGANLSGLIKQAISWAVAIGLGFLGKVLALGIFAGLPWYLVLAYGLAAGLVANGIFKANILQGIIDVMYKLFQKPQTK